MKLRLARSADIPALQRLIEESVRVLSRDRYSPAQIESALRHVFGADTQLIADRTYFVVPTPDGGLAAAGGWSRRATLYGGDQMKGTAGPLLARIGSPPGSGRSLYIPRGQGAAWHAGSSSAASAKPPLPDSTPWSSWQPCPGSRCIAPWASRRSSAS